MYNRVLICSSGRRLLSGRHLLEAAGLSGFDLHEELEAQIPLTRQVEVTCSMHLCPVGISIWLMILSFNIIIAASGLVTLAPKSPGWRRGCVLDLELFRQNKLQPKKNLDIKIESIFVTSHPCMNRV